MNRATKALIRGVVWNALVFLFCLTLIVEKGWWLPAIALAVVLLQWPDDDHEVWK